MLNLIQGPAGSGKSQVAADMLEAGEVEVLLDVTAIWAALSGARRGPDGKFPVRSEDDPALGAALYLQAVGARFALEQGARVALTTSRRGTEARWAEVARAAGVQFNTRTVDPGRDIVVARLSDPETGVLSGPCAQAIDRWYK